MTLSGPCRQLQCITCGDRPQITQKTLVGYDFHAFTGQPFNDTAPPNISLLPTAQRLGVQDLASRLQSHPVRPSAPSSQEHHNPDMGTQPVGAETPANSSAVSKHQMGPHGSHQAGISNSSILQGNWSRGPPHLASQAASSSQSPAGPLLLDVRPKEQFAAAHLPGFMNVPYEGPHKPLASSLLELCRSHQSGRSQAGDASSALAIPSSGERGPGAQDPQTSYSSSTGEPKPEAADQILVVCRRGNDSQEVVQQLHSLGITGAMDIVGGLTAWSQTVDPSFPIY